MSTPSNRLREIRLQKGLTQLELAVQAGVSISLLWLIEHGGEASRRKKIQVARALGFEVGQIFPEEAPHGTQVFIRK